MKNDLESMMLDPEFRLFGLTVLQIKMLCDFYEMTTGEKPEKILDSDHLFEQSIRVKIKRELNEPSGVITAMMQDKSQTNELEAWIDNAWSNLNVAEEKDLQKALKIIERMKDYVSGEAKYECYPMCDCQSLAEDTLKDCDRIASEK